MSGCGWENSSPEMKAYHDCKWGRPEHDDTELFAMLCLESAQAGLSWATILRKEAGYRAAFDGFDAQVIANYDEAKLEALCRDDRIVKNRLKIRSVKNNAQAFLKIQAEFGSFDAYLRRFSGGQVIDRCPQTLQEIPIFDETAQRLSRDLKRRGFSFVGPTTVYSYLQAIGMVNDHLAGCDCRKK